MNKTEAQIVLMCQHRARSVSQVWKIQREHFGKTFGYNYVSSCLSNMEKLGLMIKKKMGQTSWYRSTEAGVLEAITLLNQLADVEREKLASVSVVDNRAISEFI